MPTTAIISRNPRLTLDEWLAYVPTNKSLAPPPTMRINPFTHQPTQQRGIRGAVDIVDGGETVGGMEPDPEFDTNAELLVFTDEHPSERVMAIVSQVAVALHAQLEWIHDGD